MLARFLPRKNYTLDELYEKYNRWNTLNEKIRRNNLTIEAINKVGSEYVDKYKEEEKNALYLNDKTIKEETNNTIKELRDEAESLNTKNGVYEKEATPLRNLLDKLPEETKKKLAEKIVSEKEREEEERKKDFYSIGATDNPGKGGSKKKRNKRRKSRKKIVKKSRSIKKR